MAEAPKTEAPKMQYVRLGKTGLKVSRICLGAMSFGDPKWQGWVLNEEDSRPIIKRALELGINFFDTANMYSLGVSEEILGRALKDFTKRDEVVIATKVFFPMKQIPNCGGLSRKHIMQSIDDSLKRLGTDFVDILQIHRWDPDTPIEETVEALHDVVKSGKARYVGASSMSAWQFCKAILYARSRGFTEFISMQDHYNLIQREEEREMIPFCQSEGVGLIPWSPLARGLLTGSRKKGTVVDGDTTRSKTDNFTKLLYEKTLESDFKIIDRVIVIAEKKKVTPAQIAIAWLLHKPQVAAPIIGTTKMSQLEEAVAAVHIKLDKEDIDFLEELYVPHQRGF